MICPNCKNDVPSDHNICPNCGTNLSVRRIVRLFLVLSSILLIGFVVIFLLGQLLKGPGKKPTENDHLVLSFLEKEYPELNFNIQSYDISQRKAQYTDTYYWETNVKILWSQPGCKITGTLSLSFTDLDEITVGRYAPQRIYPGSLTYSQWVSFCEAYSSMSDSLYELTPLEPPYDWRNTRIIFNNKYDIKNLLMAENYDILDDTKKYEVSIWFNDQGTIRLLSRNERSFYGDFNDFVYGGGKPNDFDFEAWLKNHDGNI